MALENSKTVGLELEQVLKALGDPVRLSVVKQLLHADGEAIACGEFEYDVTKATFSHHIKILKDAGIISSEACGTKKLVSLCSKELNKTYPGLLSLILKD